MMAAEYDPFAPGPFRVGVRTFEAHDAARGRTFPCDIWYPAALAGLSPAEPQRDAAALPGPHPLIVFSHYSGGHRRASTFLCVHLAGHGYAVAAMDHSEVVARELSPTPGESPTARQARIDAVVAARVPDVRFLLDHLLGGSAGAGPAAAGPAGVDLDAGRVGLAGHSFGGWTVLAAVEADPRVRSVVALAPGGSSLRRPGILPLTLSFAWDRPVPVLYLAAEDDVAVPPEAVHELFERTPEPRRMHILRRADHQHFVDDVEGEHEALRAMSLPGPAAWLPAAMRPISELCSGAAAHLFVRGLTLAHLDATLRGSAGAGRFLDGDVTAALAARGVDALTAPGASRP